jgi:signal transduction histidine kinase
VAGILEKRQSLHQRLATQQQLSEQLRSQLGHMQALANIGMISAMIAHEMNNILTPLGNYAYLAMKHPEDSQLTRKALEKTTINSRRAARILESMLAMANGRPRKMDWHPVKAMIEEIFSCLARDFSKDRIKVVVDIDDELMVFAEDICLQQVLMNMILNAREAMSPKGGALTISARQDAGSVRIEIADTGCGIEQCDLAKIFQPFFTTKTESSQAARHGAGLGLAFCKRVVEAHNGAISVDSQPGCGTTFRITLPVP